MTNAQIFTAAHKLAKKHTGDYSACLSLALKNVYAGLRKGEYKKESDFALTDEAQELNMKLNRSEIFAKYGFEAILVGKKNNIRICYNVYQVYFWRL